jgi:CHAD domain-containing protein
MTAATTRSARQAGRGTRPLTAAALRLAAVPLAAERDGDLSGRFAATMDTQLRVVLEQQRQVRDLDDPEAVHQIRVAIRRMRVALRVHRDAVGTTGDELRAELGWLGGELGPVRDLDVLAERLAASGGSLGPADADGLSELLAALHEGRVRAREALQTMLDGDRYRALLRALAKLVRGSATTVDTADLAEAVAERPSDPLALLDRPLRKLRREVLAAGSTPTDEQLHTLRIRGKRLRYAAELALGLCERRQRKPLRRLISTAKDLQEVLGDHHDTVTAENWLRESFAAHNGKQPALSGSAALVAGRLLERELVQRAGYENEWPRSWHELDERARALD